MPELVGLLEEQYPNFGHVRLRLELDDALRSRSPSPDAAGGANVADDKAASSSSVPTTRARKPRASHSPMLRAGPSVDTAEDGTPPSPTAQNLANNPALRAQVMSGAIPFGSSYGQRLRGPRG